MRYKFKKMQFRHAFCTRNDYSPVDSCTKACPSVHHPHDAECCDNTVTTNAPVTSTTTCHPKTREWSPCSNCNNIDSNYCEHEPDNCTLKEDCERAAAASPDDYYYRSPQRSNRLFSPVFPTKAKPRKKRQRKPKATTIIKVPSTGTGAATITTDKPITSTTSFKEAKAKQNDQKASLGAKTTKKSSPSKKPDSDSGGGTITKSPIAKSTKSSSPKFQLKSKSPPVTPKSPSPVTRKSFHSKSGGSPVSTSTGSPLPTPPKSPKFFYLRKVKKKAPIDWRKPPKIPIKHTVTSKVRNENWFADCGRYRVKAYRGDWNNLPEELTRDPEVFQRFFKHRRPVKKNTSLVKKLVQGKITLQKSRVDKKPFQKRSPVLPAAGEKSKPKSKLKKSHFDVRGARFNLRKEPLIRVKHTLTSSLRRHLDTHSCDKPQTPTLWHGSVEEMEELKKKIDQRRGQRRNHWKKNDRARNDSMNNLIIASSSGSSVIVEGRANRRHHSPKTHPRKSAKKSANVVNRGRKSKIAPVSTLPQPHPVNEIRNFQKTIAIKVLPAGSESILVSSHGHGHSHSRRRCKPQATDVLSSECGGATDTAKWMLPPSIPIRYSLTSIMRQRSTNKFSENGLKVSSNGARPPW